MDLVDTSSEAQETNPVLSQQERLEIFVGSIEEMSEETRLRVLGTFDIDSLIVAYRSKGNRILNSTILKYLIANPTREAVDFLKSQVEFGTEHEVEVACEALSQIHTPEVVDWLVSILRNKDIYTKWRYAGEASGNRINRTLEICRAVAKQEGEKVINDLIYATECDHSEHVENRLGKSEYDIDESGKCSANARKECVELRSCACEGLGDVKTDNAEVEKTIVQALYDAAVETQKEYLMMMFAESFPFLSSPYKSVDRPDYPTLLDSAINSLINRGSPEAVEALEKIALNQESYKLWNSLFDKDTVGKVEQALKGMNH